jgi:predicted methyltransferase
MRAAVIAAVRDSGQFVEKPTGDEQQSVVFRADRFKVTCEVSASGGSTTQEHEQILRSANAIIEAAKAEHIRQEAIMADLAYAQAAITESINQSVNDAITNALKPGGVLHAFHTRT